MPFARTKKSGERAVILGGYSIVCLLFPPMLLLGSLAPINPVGITLGVLSAVIAWPLGAASLAGAALGVATLPIAAVIDSIEILAHKIHGQRRYETVIAEVPPPRTREPSQAARNLMLQLQRAPEVKQVSPTKIAGGQYPDWVDHCSSEYFIEYVKLQSQKPKISDRIKSLGDLSAEETEKLRQFEDRISFEYMDIPVMLNEKVYDVATIATLNHQDPLTRYHFDYDNITPSRSTLEKFDEVFNEITRQRNEKSCGVATGSICSGDATISIVSMIR